MENKKVIGVAQVLQHLKDGMTRDDIAEHYDISKTECKLLFQHPDLKGKKTIKKPSFIIVDDATADNIVLDAPVVDEEVVEDTVGETEEAKTEEAEVVAETVEDTKEEEETEEQEEEGEEDATEEVADPAPASRPSPVWE